MRPLTLVVLAPVVLGGALAVTACDKPKPRHLPPDPFGGPVAAPEPPPTEGLSAGLEKRSEMPGFFLDHVGKATDPLTRRPAVTPVGEPIQLDGFGFDPVAKAPAKGVDVVIDGKAYGTTYGSARPDVAAFFKARSLVNVGFRAALPAGTLKPGPHVAIVRVVSNDGEAYYDSPAVPFEVR